MKFWLLFEYPFTVTNSMYHLCIVSIFAAHTMTTGTITLVITLAHWKN